MKSVDDFLDGLQEGKDALDEALLKFQQLEIFLQDFEDDDKFVNHFNELNKHRKFKAIKRKILEFEEELLDLSDEWSEYVDNSLKNECVEGLVDLYNKSIVHS